MTRRKMITGQPTPSRIRLRLKSDAGGNWQRHPKVAARPVPAELARPERAGGFQVVHHSLEYQTTAPLQFIDLTDEVRTRVAQSGIANGMVNVQTRHTTTAVIINEHEPLLLDDLKALLTRIAPPQGYYRHNDFAIRTANMTPDETPNGHAHCQSLLLSSSATVNVIDGALQLGRWQRIFSSNWTTRARAPSRSPSWGRPPHLTSPDLSEKQPGYARALACSAGQTTDARGRVRTADLAVSIQVFRGGSMEILLAESFGFCMGVKRAVDLAYRAIEKASGLPVVTLGPLIHNKQETDRLTRDGIGCADLDSLPAAGTVVIRAHGVGPKTFAELRARGLRVLDATCPYVHYSQRRAVELQAAGYTVVIAGVREHPEIRGILDHLNGEAHVVKTPEEARALPFCDRIGVIAQTTIAGPKYQAIIAALRERARELQVCETICDATADNQAAVRRLAADVELLYIVGGRHSDNSNKLFETARECCPRALLIETEEEIRPEDLRGVSRVGVSAGASAPDWMIQRVIARLRALGCAENAAAPTTAPLLAIAHGAK